MAHGHRPVPARFPIRIRLTSLAGWMFDVYDLVLFSFLLVPIGHDLGLTQARETTLLGVALGGSGIGGILSGYLSDRFGRRRWSWRSRSWDNRSWQDRSLECP